MVQIQEEIQLSDPYETDNTLLNPLHNALIEYKDYYGNSICYAEQFFQIGEFLFCI